MTRNDPACPYQRRTVTQSQGDIIVSCTSSAVVHGNLGSDKLGTALVFSFDLNMTEPHARIETAKFSFRFRSSAPDVPGPEICRLTPEGSFTFWPTSREVSTTRGCDLKAETPAFISLGGSLKWEEVVHETVTDQARLVGSLICDDLSNPNCASWTLAENTTAKTGVPSHMQAAILLERPNDGDFVCDFTMKLKTDWRHEVRRVFSCAVPDEPILFCPALPPRHPPTSVTSRYPMDPYPVGEPQKCLEWLCRHFNELGTISIESAVTPLQQSSGNKLAVRTRALSAPDACPPAMDSGGWSSSCETLMQVGRGSLDDLHDKERLAT